MSYRKYAEKRTVTRSEYICDLCGKPIVVAGWVLGRDPKKQKTHYHIDCLITLADWTVHEDKSEQEYDPTDTNQASEDELIYGVDLGIPGGDNTALSIKKGSTPYTFVGDEAVAIIDLIRTEKLKLLAEVRKQQLPAIVLKAKKPHDEVQIQAVSIDVLNQLEAEL